jgi:molybdate transport system substrate-binding protein
LGAFFLVAVACARQPAPPHQSPPLTVHAAASLIDTFPALAEAFKSSADGSTVLFNFAGSQQLAQQLAAGAPGDLFASADERQMTAVVNAGRVAEEEVRVLAANTLIVVLPQANPGAVTRLEDLARPGLKVVLADAAVPAGAYSREFLEKASSDPDFAPTYATDVLANVVSFEQNVRAVLTKVSLGEADAGIVYASDVAGDAGQKVQTLTITQRLNVRATYYIAPLRDAVTPETARSFLAFTLSAEGQALLADGGLLPAQPVAAELP